MYENSSYDQPFQLSCEKGLVSTTAKIQTCILPWAVYLAWNLEEFPMFLHVDTI